MRKCQRRPKKMERREKKKNTDGWSIDVSIRSVCIMGIGEGFLLPAWMKDEDECVKDDMRTNHIGHSTIYFNDAATFCAHTTHCQFIRFGYESHLADINYMTGAKPVIFWLSKTDTHTHNEQNVQETLMQLQKMYKKQIDEEKSSWSRWSLLPLPFAGSTALANAFRVNYK